MCFLCFLFFSISTSQLKKCYFIAKSNNNQTAKADMKMFNRICIELKKMYYIELLIRIAIALMILFVFLTTLRQNFDFPLK